MHKMDKTEVAGFIKQIAKEAGFAFCGIAKAELMQPEAKRLETWLKRGYQGKMQYLENHFDKRIDPTQLVPGAKTVVSLGYNYFPQKDISENQSYKIAKYAYGEDYHRVVKDKLFHLLNRLTEKYGQINGRAFVDSAPVLERDWAQRAGNGWIGKNSLLLNRSMGSFFFLAELIIDLEADVDAPIGDYCGTCTACIDACPTDAITETYRVDGSKCISYYTIELKENIPVEAKGKMEDWIFGCDICQDVCPWNRFAKPHNEERFKPLSPIQNFTKKEWEEITEEVFRATFKHSPLKRTGYEGLLRNIQMAKEE
jgi:epoxyqueuosine reductase